MNAERMHAVARRLREDLRQTQLQNKLAELATAARQAASTPGNADRQQQVSNRRSEILTTLAGSQANDFSPVERLVLDEWGISGILGQSLAATIEGIFTRNQITMATAAEQLEQLVAPLNQAVENLDRIIAAFDGFHVGYEELDAGQFEIDVLIPKRAVRGELGRLGKELTELNDIFSPFVELATGSAEPLIVESIGSSDFTVFIQSAASVSAAVSQMLSQLIELYRSIVEIRTVKEKIGQLPIPDEGATAAAAIGPLEDYANRAITEGSTRIAEAIVSAYAAQRLPEGRANELTFSIKRSIVKLADRIDDGYNVSVRTGPLAPEPPEESEDQAALDNARYAVEVADRSKELQFMNLTGEPILSLGEGQDESGEEE